MMKRQFLLSGLIFFRFIGMAQDYPDLDSVLNRFEIITVNMESVLKDLHVRYTSLEELTQRYDNAISDYRNDPVRFNEAIENIENWSDEDGKRINTLYGESIEARIRLEREIQDGFRNFLLQEKKEFEKPSSIGQQAGTDWLNPETGPDLGLSFYNEKIRETRKQMNNLLNEYDSCRNVSPYQHCDNLFASFLSTLSLSELYHKRYLDIMTEFRAELGKNPYFEEYLNSYREFYTKYLVSSSQLKQSYRPQMEGITSLSEEISNEYRILRSHVLDHLESIAHKKYMGLENEIKQLNSGLNRELGLSDYYYYLVEFQHSIAFMHASMNPELNINDLLFKLEPFLNWDFPSESKARTLQQCCADYLENLDLLAKVISNYEEIPYFCFYAYPRYSNELVDENLEIINSRIDFEREDLGYRTRQFLEITELDLSDSNFSMDLLLKDHKNIRKLDLSNTRISSVENLVNTNLEWLDLSNTDIDREDLQFLRSMESIEYLDLSDTGIKRMEINELCYHLKIKKKNCIIKKKEENEPKETIVTLNSSTSY